MHTVPQAPQLSTSFVIGSVYHAIAVIVAVVARSAPITHASRGPPSVPKSSAPRSAGPRSPGPRSPEPIVRPARIDRHGATKVDAHEVGGHWSLVAHRKCVRMVAVQAPSTATKRGERHGAPSEASRGAASPARARCAPGLARVVARAGARARARPDADASEHEAERAEERRLSYAPDTRPRGVRGSVLHRRHRERERDEHAASDHERTAAAEGERTAAPGRCSPRSPSSSGVGGRRRPALRARGPAVGETRLDVWRFAASERRRGTLCTLSAHEAPPQLRASHAEEERAPGGSKARSNGVERVEVVRSRRPPACLGKWPRDPRRPTVARTARRLAQSAHEPRTIAKAAVPSVKREGGHERETTDARYHGQRHSAARHRSIARRGARRRRPTKREATSAKRPGNR